MYRDPAKSAGFGRPRLIHFWYVCVYIYIYIYTYIFYLFIFTYSFTYLTYVYVKPQTDLASRTTARQAIPGQKLPWIMNLTSRPAHLAF